MPSGVLSVMLSTKMLENIHCEKHYGHLYFHVLEVRLIKSLSQVTLQQTYLLEATETCQNSI